MKLRTIPLLWGSSFEGVLETYWSKGIPELWILSVKILIFIRRNKKKDFFLLRILLQIADLHLGDVDEDVYRGVCSEHQVVPPAHIPVTRAAPFSLWLRQTQAMAAQSFEFGRFHWLFLLLTTKKNDERKSSNNFAYLDKTSAQPGQLASSPNTIIW